MTAPAISKIYRDHSIIVWRFVAEGLSCTPVKHPIQLWIIAFTGVLGIQYVPQLLCLGLNLIAVVFNSDQQALTKLLGQQQLLMLPATNFDSNRLPKK